MCNKDSQKQQPWPKFYHFLATTSQKTYLTNPDEISPTKQNLLIELWLTGMKNSWTYSMTHLSEKSRLTSPLKPSNNPISCTMRQLTETLQLKTNTHGI